MTHTAHPHGAPTAAPALPDLGPGWDYLTITIPINRNDIDVEQVAHEAADAVRAILDKPA